MKKALRDCVCFANWCNQYTLVPRDAATLIELAHKAFSAGERECNTGQSADRQRHHVEAHAIAMGLTASWPGLAPEFKTKDGRECRLPCLS